MVLKQDWAELSQAQPSPHETTYCLINRNLNVSNHGVAQKEVKDLRLFSKLYIVFFKSDSPSTAKTALKSSISIENLSKIVLLLLLILQLEQTFSVQEIVK